MKRKIFGETKTFNDVYTETLERLAASLDLEESRVRVNREELSKLLNMQSMAEREGYTFFTAHSDILDKIETSIKNNQALQLSEYRELAVLIAINPALDKRIASIIGTNLGKDNLNEFSKDVTSLRRSLVIQQRKDAQNYAGVAFSAAIGFGVFAILSIPVTIALLFTPGLQVLIPIVIAIGVVSAINGVLSAIVGAEFNKNAYMADLHIKEMDQYISNPFNARKDDNAYLVAGKKRDPYSKLRVERVESYIAEEKRLEEEAEKQINDPNYGFYTGSPGEQRMFFTPAVDERVKAKLKDPATKKRYDEKRKHLLEEYENTTGKGKEKEGSSTAVETKEEKTEASKNDS